MASEAGAGPALDAATREIPELEALLTQAMIAGASHGSGEARLDDAYDAAARLVRGLRGDGDRATRYEVALRTIGGWDCLNPPNTALCADFPWLRRLVDDALGTTEPEPIGDELMRLRRDLARERERATGLERALRDIRSRAYYGVERATAEHTLSIVEGMARKALGMPMDVWALDAPALAADAPGEGGSQ